MSERNFEGVLVHVYSQPDHSGKIKLDIRGHMQVTAAAMLYKSGEARNFFIGGGHIYGEDKPSAASVYAREIVKRGVPESNVFQRDDAVETGAELNSFKEVSEENGWENTGALANRSHTPRITYILETKGMDNISVVSAEDVLVTEKKFRPFLRRFRISPREFIFSHREILARAVYRRSQSTRGTTDGANIVSKNPTVQRIKDFLDR